jgi:hypothetical protein
VAVGPITRIEMHLLTLIKRTFVGDESQKYLSNIRVEKAIVLQAERRRMNQDTRFLDCLVNLLQCQRMSIDKIERK